MDAILVVNAGSSSLRFQLFEVERKALSSRIQGQIDGIGGRPRLKNYRLAPVGSAMCCSRY